MLMCALYMFIALDNKICVGRLMCVCVHIHACLHA